MKIVEVFVQGKNPDQSLCEDFVYVNKHFACVVDGATDPSGATFDGVSGGRWIGERIIETLPTLNKNMKALEALNTVNLYVSKKFKKAKKLGGSTYKPSASIIIYSNKRKELWIVGDCQVLYNNKHFKTVKKIDEVSTALSNVWSWYYKLQGMSQKQLQDQDPGFEKSMEVVRIQKYFANTTDTPYSYPVMDGTPLIKSQVNILKVKNVSELVLASDGYPVLKNSLKKTEKILHKKLQSDPVNLYDASVGRSKKTGCLSYDDRCFLRLGL